MLKKLIVFFVIILFSNIYAQNTYLDSHFQSEFYKHQWVGFYLFDPETQKEIYSYQGNKFFIPASNVKILTLYTGLKLLPDSIPSLQYVVKQDTIYIRGTGDPALLESYFKERKVIDFLSKRNENIVLYNKHFNDSKYAPGWSWDDYSESYSPERSSFPLYGNIVSIAANCVIPALFSKNIKKEKKEYSRDFLKNIFYLTGSKKQEIPFITSDSLIRELLQAEVKKTVFPGNYFPKGDINTLFSIPADSLYKRMMLMSDNFIAEQILLMSSLFISDTMNSKTVIEYILSNHLKNIPLSPRWIDGSGLSRYNTFTPQYFVYVLNEMYKEIPEKRLLSLLPAGGIDGTLKNSYKSNSPYIFAKTGSMSQVYNLSGFLKTKSGKTLIFSYLNNNFMHTNAKMKTQMQKVLEYVRDSY